MNMFPFQLAISKEIKSTAVERKKKNEQYSRIISCQTSSGKPSILEINFPTKWFAISICIVFNCCLAPEGR